MDGAAEDGGITVKDALPEIVAEDSDGGTAGEILLGRELTAVLRRDAENAEIAGGDALLRDELEAAIGGKVDAGGAGVSRGSEERGAVAHGEEESAGLAVIDLFPIVGGDDEGEARGVGIRQGLEQDGIEHAEDGGIDADAEGERKEDDGGEGGGLSELADGEADISPERHVRLYDSRRKWFRGELCRRTGGQDARVLAGVVEGAPDATSQHLHGEGPGQ